MQNLVQFEMRIIQGNHIRRHGPWCSRKVSSDVMSDSSKWPHNENVMFCDTDICKRLSLDSIQRRSQRDRLEKRKVLRHRREFGDRELCEELSSEVTLECHSKVQDPQQPKHNAGIEKRRHREQADHNNQQSEADKKSRLIEK